MEFMRVLFRSAQLRRPCSAGAAGWNAFQRTGRRGAAAGGGPRNRRCINVFASPGQLNRAELAPDVASGPRFTAMTENASANREWSVGELAAAAGVTVRTLHHYEQVGLLAPASRTGAGHRRYRAEQAERLYQITAM